MTAGERGPIPIGGGKSPHRHSYLKVKYKGTLLKYYVMKPGAEGWPRIQKGDCMPLENVF